MTRVSIIIPALNEEPVIAEACRRALALRPHEAIVVDGGSTDETASLAEAAGCRVIASPRGRAIQQNAGASVTTGDVLFFLHADTWLAEGALAQITEALADARVIGGGFRQRIEASGLAFRLLERGNALRGATRRMFYGDQGIFVRRETFEAAGRFPEIPLMEDVRLLRALRRRGSLALLPGPLYVSARRWRRHGVARQTLRNWSLLIAERLGARPERLAEFYRRHDL